MRKSIKTTLAVLAAAATLPVVMATAGSATDVGGLELVTNGNGNSDEPSMSDDGRFTVFVTRADDLPGSGVSSTGEKNIVVYDRTADTFITLTASGGTANPAISGNGQYVVFSHNTNSGFTAVKRVELNGTGGVVNAVSIAAGNDHSRYPQVANNGDVVFESEATDLVAGDLTGTNDVFLYKSGVRSEIAVGGLSTQSRSTSISDDGTLIAYSRHDGSDNQIYTYDVATSTETKRTFAGDDSNNPAVNADGSVVAFGSYANEPALPGSASVTHQQIFTWSSGGVVKHTSGNQSSHLADISADGAYVAFSSKASNLSAAADVNGGRDFFRVQVSNSNTVRLSSDVMPNASAGYVTMNGDGSLGAFSTRDGNEIPGMNTNGNVIIWGQALATPTTSTTMGTTSTTAGPTPTTPTTAPPATSGGAACKPTNADRVEFELTSTASNNNVMWRAYCVALNRRPDIGGFEYWLGVKETGPSWEFIEATMVDSAEFRNTYGNPNNQEFIDRIYDVILDRGADPGGRAYWIGLMDDGTLDRGGILFYFSNSQEFKNLTATA